MGGGYRSLRFEPRTVSHVVHTRCLIFSLSEICVTLLGISIECITLGVRRPSKVVLKPRRSSNPYLTNFPMSSKKHKLSSKRNQASEEPAHDYDHEKFVNANAAEKFSLFSKNQSFIKEKGFHHPDYFFLKTIGDKE